jgi:hypothetical protein
LFRKIIKLIIIKYLIMIQQSEPKMSLRILETESKIFRDSLRLLETV